jgi:predicted HTH domain antitoxin
MSDNIENYLTLTQKYATLLVGANKNEPITGKVWFQKELFLVSQNIPRLEDETEFEGSLMGPYSENADAELDQLRIEGIVELNGKIRLTAIGQELAKKLETRASKETMEVISEMKSFLNDLSEDELLGFIYFSYPSMVIESIKFEDIKRKRGEIGVSLYRKRKVSLGKAALIAGLSQEDFIKKAQANNVTIFSE